MAISNTKLTPPRAPHKKTRLTESAVAKQIEKSFGNIAAVAKAFGVTRKAVYDFIGKRPALREALTDAREQLIDDAESALHAAVLRCEGWAVSFTLKTVGRDRGYAEFQSLDVKHEGSIDVRQLPDADLNARIAARIAEIAGQAGAGAVAEDAGGAPAPRGNAAGSAEDRTG